MDARLSSLSLFAGLTLTLAFSSAASAGTIYLDDNGTVYSFSPTGVRSVYSTQGGQTAIGMAFDSSGNLYAASRDTNAVIKIAPGGGESTFASVSEPYGLALDAAGNVYTTAPFSNDIMKYTPAGAGSVFATATYGYSLAFDSSGDLFEAASDGNLYEYAPNGTRTTFATVPIGGSIFFGMTFDASGNLYAGDWGGQILKFAPNGTSSVFASFSNQILPTGLVYDYATGNIYMSEVANGVSTPGQQAIYAFSPSGAETTFATGLYNAYAIADLQNPSSAPEPGSVALFGGGLAMLAAKRFRRSR